MYGLIDRRTFLLGASSAAASALLPQRVFAQSKSVLRIGLSTEVTTIDPHAENRYANNALATHIFDSLVAMGDALDARPGLASSWRPLDDLTWEFRLNPAAKFSDGSPFTAEDAIASLQRPASITGVASFTTYTRSISDMSAPEPHRLIIKTSAPDPLLPSSLRMVRMIKATFAKADRRAFETSEAAIGTGPYKLVEYRIGDRVMLERNESYWGEPPAFERVILRFIPNEGSRVAALLAGELDLIEQMPAAAAERVQSASGFQVVSGAAARVVFLTMDLGRDATPFAFDNSGKPLAANPFKMPKVREAISAAINRDVLIARALGGSGVPMFQYLQKGGFGNSDSTPPTAYDPERAKRLLAEAGFPGGFRVTIHGPSGRFANDSNLIQALGQFLTRVGIKTAVEIMPWTVYSTRYLKGEFSVFIGTWGMSTGDVSEALLALNVTRDPKQGTGATNSSSYSNNDLDQIVLEARNTMDESARKVLIEKASAIVFGQHIVIPLYNEASAVGTKKSISYRVRADQYMLAMNAKMN